MTATSVPGLGWFHASTRLAASRSLGRICKRGSRYLRTLFVQAAQVILMRPHNWPSFSFGAWLEEGSKRLHRNKLAVALVNRLARILRHAGTFDVRRLEAPALQQQTPPTSSRLR